MSSGGARGGKARLESNSPLPEKPCVTRVFGNSILTPVKMLGGEAQSKKPRKGFFDKLTSPSLQVRSEGLEEY